ncbi:MAG: hypothetical protein DWI06_01200 [Planctomycetota bacterium]|nr:MAG: hypothetical protein DWI06_01200 [Planctomycetota bacterium]
MSDGNIIPSLGARSKGSNGGVAVGLPHRNSSVLKQAAPNKRQVKGRDPPSAVGGLKGIDTRVGSWGKNKKVKKKKEKQMRNYCFIDQLLPVPNK